MTKTRARYTLEFKPEAVRLVEGGLRISAIVDGCFSLIVDGVSA